MITLAIGNITFSSRKMKEDTGNCLKLSKLVSLKVCELFPSTVLKPKRNV